MPEIEHNAPRFQYRIYYKRDIVGEEYQVVDIPDWTQNQYIIENQPTFQPYRIKVVAMNQLGEANVAPQEVIGYSGEDGKFYLRSQAVWVIYVGRVNTRYVLLSQKCPCRARERYILSQICPKVKDRMRK